MKTHALKNKPKKTQGTPLKLLMNVVVLAKRNAEMKSMLEESNFSALPTEL